MGRNRVHHKGLPRGVYVRSAAYYFVGKDKRWVRLARLGEYGEMLRRLAELVGPAPAYTVRDVLDQYERSALAQLADKTRREYTAHLKLLREVFGNMAVDAVKPDHVRQFLRQGKAPTLRNRQTATLSAAYTWAVEAGHAKGNPCRGVARNKEQRRANAVTDREFDAVYALADARLRVAMDLALLTGLRQSDIRALTLDNVTDAGLEVRTEKTGTVVCLEWSDALREVVRRARALRPQVPGHYLLRTVHGRPYKAAHLRMLWQRLMRLAASQGLRRFTWNDIRAKSASDSGSIEEATARLGHANPATTIRHYYRGVRRAKPLR